MADGEKFSMKAGAVLPFLSNFGPSKDGTDYLFTTLDMSGKNIEQLNKTIGDEAKEVYRCILSNNNIADPSILKELSNLVHLDLSANKIKNVAIFTVEDNFV